eukprot:1764784-Rhodomonas_salina.3
MLKPWHAILSYAATLCWYPMLLPHVPTLGSYPRLLPCVTTLGSHPRLLPYPNAPTLGFYPMILFNPLLLTHAAPCAPDTKIPTMLLPYFTALCFHCMLLLANPDDPTPYCHPRLLPEAPTL